ncbi:transmembrane protein 161B-like [Tubulanus polymorphus]|uniref:transmembrane protein 161B-like n=1 Tax=Tubulanus polymorphus TaxID=672921 RepID=UPI003DA531F0
MAILGVQLVVTMVTASFLSKLSQHFSFARWLLCNHLVRYLHPTDEELRITAGIPLANKGKGRKDKHGIQKGDTFTVPRSLNIQLETAAVRPIDLLPLHYYAEYQWLIDFSLSAFFVYVITEVYVHLFPQFHEFNLSMLWSLLVMLFSLKVMFSLTAMYFRLEESGERILCVTFGFFFLIVAMGILITSEDTLEFGLVPGHGNFSKTAEAFLKDQGISSHGPASITSFKLGLAFLSAIVGAFLTFPGLRYAKMHSDSLKYAKERPLVQLLLHLSFLFPLLISVMWIKPAVKDVLTSQSRSSSKPLLTEAGFFTMRIIFIVAFCLLRLFLMVVYLQSHLNLAHDKIEQMHKEAGRISNIDLQRMIARVFFYLCAVALQYLAPVVLLLFAAFCWKTLGGLSWSGKFLFIPDNSTTLVTNSTKQPVTLSNASLPETVAHIGVALNQLKSVFTPIWYRGLFSYLCWWISTAWFVTSAFGMLYYQYFAQ